MIMLFIQVIYTKNDLKELTIYYEYLWTFNYSLVKLEWLEICHMRMRQLIVVAITSSHHMNDFFIIV